MQIALDAHEKCGLAPRCRHIACLTNVAQCILPVACARERRAKRINVSRRVFVFRLDRFPKLLDSFLEFLLIHQDAAQIEVCLAVAGFVLNGFPVFGFRFRKIALPL